LASVGILCTDKTGTLTANRLLFNDIYPLGNESADEVKAAPGDFSRSASSHNKTSEAILALGATCAVSQQIIARRHGFSTYIVAFTYSYSQDRYRDFQDRYYLC